MIPVVYEGLCPICNGDLREEEIIEKVCFLKNKKFDEICHNREEKDLEKLFEKVVGKPREIQKFWMRRICRGESFAAVAPTGIGKTAFGLVTSLYFAMDNRKSYIIVPTTLLVEQAAEEIRNFCTRLGLKVGLNSEGDIPVAFYHGRMGGGEKKAFGEILKEAKILITTAQFLSKRFDEIKDLDFYFIFVDDVDAILKSSKNVDRILNLLGFWKEGNEWKGRNKGILMVSTATASRGKATRLFRELLNFDVGSSFFTIRNVEDIIVKGNGIDMVRNILKRMGKGGIIYASSQEEAESYFEELKKDFKIGIAISKKKNDYEEFEKGNLDFLIGTAAYYGTLVRGLDLPERIRYVVFTRAPIIKVRYEELSPNMLKVLALIFRKDERIKKFLPILPKIERYPKRIEELKRIIKEVSSKEKVEDMVIRDKEILFPDIKTYLQGSGRASRLTVKGLTKGASFLCESDENILKTFIKRASYFDIFFKEIENVDIEKLAVEIDKSRKRGAKKMIRPALFIVESPTKAKLISRFFGKPSIKVYENGIVYEVATEKYILLVTACLGHVVDLSFERGFHGVEVNEKFIPIYASIKKCKNCNHQFTHFSSCPRCGSSDVQDSKDRIDVLRKLASQTGLVIIGTDPDAEGEKIAWDLANLLAGVAEVKRAEFHEVTPRAVKQALENLREIDENRVKAQVVRRIEDRWIGFALSQKLWEVFGRHNLSAGRVQTPVLEWIIDQELKFKKKKRISFLPELGISLDGVKSGEIDLEIELIGTRSVSMLPAPPYTTDELLRDANRIMKINSSDAMRIAQDLFENGLITYHRTDSTRVSDVGLRIAKEYLGDDFVGRRWEGKEEGAHECIRPTRAWDRGMVQRMIYERVLHVENFSPKHLSMYDLIFKRFMASQCREFKVDYKKYRINWDDKFIEVERAVRAEGKAFELYRNLQVKEEFPVGKIRTRVEERKVPEGFPLSQADVVRLMKERGLGRPSTYATILDKLFLRDYVVERKRYLFSTELGKRVHSYLVQNYPSLISEERTRFLFDKIDKIERAEAGYFETLKELYDEIKNAVK